MPIADLVLEGGGVKGTGLAGAISGLVDNGDPYTFNRVAGTSAGAIVASFVAAGYSAAELKQLMLAQDFADFEDESTVFKHFKKFGEGFGLLFHEGLFRGDALHTWIAATLAAKGVTTWADLKIDDDTLPPNERYKLVVIVSDVSGGRELRLPWDYETELGVPAEHQLVADAVRASASIPFFFRPFHLPAAKERTENHGWVLCTDGGMLSNYPIDIFDRPTNARWPTIGVKLSARQQLADVGWTPDPNAFDLAKSLLATMLNAHDALHVDDPYYSSRTIFVDTTGYSSTDFHLTQDNKLTLFGNGATAATKFLTTWDYAAWRAQYPERAPRPPVVAAPIPGSPTPPAAAT
jgi:NTE family protein